MQNKLQDCNNKREVGITMTNKTPRSATTREKQSRRKTWSRPSSLDAPPAPEGFAHRWIRESIMNYDDKKNISARLREGFELVRSDEYPDFEAPTVQDGKYAGVIGVGGLLLARIPNETRAERNDYFAQKTDDQNTAVEQNLMREQHPSMPIHQDRQSRVTFGGDRKPD
jgi:hypothetical protein|tara:strand:- start:4574 stop:5080 length:507 start_codon:yes stop_codon:yes gene_type:complete